VQWIADSPVPGTVAQALREAKLWDFGTPLDFDARDWWYRAELRAEDHTTGSRYVLRLDGLATLAQVWLNGELILESDNMFQAHALDVSNLLREINELVICFRSLGAALAQRRPRPRWKTRLVQHQQLRWFRTTLLGRIPGWSPPVAPVGPWRAIALEPRSEAALTDTALRPSVEGEIGRLDFSAVLPLAASVSVTATLSVGGTLSDLTVERIGTGYRLFGHVADERLALWWPHTHGRPSLHEWRVDVRVDGRRAVALSGRTGFKRVDVDQRGGDFRLQINGTEVFCRGACWTVNDIVSLTGTAEDLEHSLRLARDAGMNMVRVGGTMIYEQDAFYRLCDELGILVWQDFMFANMDYPIEDDTFRRSVEREAVQQLQRLRQHPCVAVYCGNSEVEQQAAMLGMPRELWRNRLFSILLPALCEREHPGIPYVPSTPSGGALPFHVGTGLTHYYGVGAYLRAVAWVRRDNVRFTAECLGFSNVPEPRTVEQMFGGDASATHHPRWKERVPRDSGAGWDFEDVRDHYLREMFGLDPVRLRWADTPRYLALSRVTTGELMSQVYSEWRSVHSRCGGALVWFLRDLWPGAGWGILDSRGRPKACYYYLRRTWQPRAVLLTDEGLDGVQAHVVNDTASELRAVLELTLLRDGHIIVANARVPCEIPPRGKANFASDAMLGAFYDVSYAYRFGPPKHDVVVATLWESEQRVISEAFLFPQSPALAATAQCSVIVTAHRQDDSSYELAVSCDRFVYAAHLDVDGFMPDDDYFHVMPGRRRIVRLRPASGVVAPPKGYLEALNVDEPVRIGIAQ
jgi:beta-mannosidase